MVLGIVVFVMVLEENIVLFLVNITMFVVVFVMALELAQDAMEMEDYN